MFSKCKLLFSDQANPSSAILQLPITFSFSASLTISVQFYSSQLNPLFKTILIIFFIGFLIFPYPIWPHATTSIGYTKPYAKPSQLNQYHNTLWAKYAAHQKVESLRAASISKVDNTVNNSSIFNTKYAEFSTKW